MIIFYFHNCAQGKIISIRNFFLTLYSSLNIDKNTYLCSCSIKAKYEWKKLVPQKKLQPRSFIRLRGNNTKVFPSASPMPWKQSIFICQANNNDCTTLHYWFIFYEFNKVETWNLVMVTYTKHKSCVLCTHCVGRQRTYL